MDLGRDAFTVSYDPSEVSVTAITAKIQGLGPMDVDELRVHMVFYRPRRYRYDEDNLVARMKSGLDGIADLIKVDDHKFRITHEISDEIGNCVILKLIPVRNGIAELSVEGTATGQLT